ncbi:MAG: alpha/beta hydrolase [Actinomycetota bacterium]
MSSDHVNVAIHDFGGTGRPLVLSHATGFHAHCYLPIADHLDDRFRAFAFDHRGHGNTPRPDPTRSADGSLVPLDWTGYGDDATTAVSTIAPDGGVVAFGHSMGAASLLMAAHRSPGLFDVIVAYEPIIFPADRDPGFPSDAPPPIVEAARRRRASFDSFEDAIANFSSKPPLSMLDPDCLRLYVGHGFRPAPEGVRIVCAPDHEAGTFLGGARHRTWDLLPEIQTRVVVIGSGDGAGPSQVAEGVAEQLPNSLFIHQPDATHFQPLVDPAGTADLIADMAG